MAAPAAEQWHTPIWALWSDFSLNWMVCFCPCCAYADNVTRLDGRYAAWCPPCFAFTCASFILSCALVGAVTRREIRESFSLPAEPCGDPLVHCLCCWCALAQEAREIKYRSRLVGPSSLAAQLVTPSGAPEVQLMARLRSSRAGKGLGSWPDAPSPAGGHSMGAAGSAGPPRRAPAPEAAGQLVQGSGGGVAAAAGPSRLCPQPGEGAEGRAVEGQGGAGELEARGAGASGVPDGGSSAIPPGLMLQTEVELQAVGSEQAAAARSGSLVVPGRSKSLRLQQLQQPPDPLPE